MWSKDHNVVHTWNNDYSERELFSIVEKCRNLSTKKTLIKKKKICNYHSSFVI